MLSRYCFIARPLIGPAACRCRHLNERDQSGSTGPRILRPACPGFHPLGGTIPRMRLVSVSLASVTAACLLLSGAARAQEAKTATRSTLAGSARVERVDRTTRILTIRTEPGATRDV